MWQAINEAGIWSGEIWNRRKSGDLYLERVSINTLNDAEGKVTHYVAMFTDITAGQSREIC
jgi:PAS domain-containing protein